MLFYMSRLTIVPTYLFLDMGGGFILDSFFFFFSLEDSIYKTYIYFVITQNTH